MNKVLGNTLSGKIGKIRHFFLLIKGLPEKINFKKLENLNTVEYKLKGLIGKKIKLGLGPFK